MRSLALAGLVAAASVSFGPAPASAMCYQELWELTGYCSPCEALGLPYGIADRATGGDLLGPLHCPE